MHRDTFHVGPDSGIGKHCNRDDNETPTKELETAIDFGILLLETVMRGNKVTAGGDYRHFPLLPEGWREDIVGQREQDCHVTFNMRVENSVDRLYFLRIYS